MHRLLFFCPPPTMLPPEDTHEIDVDAVAALLGGSDAATIRLIDCREPDEHALCRIEGADLIPLSRFAEESAHRLPDPTDDSAPALIVYCHHGMRSLNATRFLRQKGHRRVWSLRGGIDAWSQEIDPSVPRY